MSTNTLTIDGRLSEQPLLRTTNSGTQVANFSLAHQHRRKTDHGWEDDGTTWVDVAVFGRRAEVVAGLAKGTVVLVAGTVKLETFQRRDGSEGRALRMTAQDVAVIPTTQTPTHGAPSPATGQPDPFAGYGSGAGDSTNPPF